MNLLEKIKNTFKNTPSDSDRLRELLSLRKFEKEELAELAIDFTFKCFCEYRDASNPKIEELTVENMHSNFIIDAIKLLLEFGLDPNIVVDDENAMWNTMWIDAPNVAAEVMKLFLENGGNPNHYNPGESETLFEYITFEISYEEFIHNHLYTFQCWLLLLAYGGCYQANGVVPVTMLGDNSVEIFKNYELYDYVIEQLPQEPGKYGCWNMHIYNVETKEEVAIF